MGNITNMETLEPVLNSVRAALPDGWQAKLVGHAPGATLRIRSRAGQEAFFPVLVASVNPSSIAEIASVAATRTEPDGAQAGFVVLAPYLSKPARGALERAGLGYADTTGWVRLVSDRPMIAITGTGADRSPTTDKRRQTLTLKGVSAGRIVQALLSAVPPIGVRELAGAAGVSPGAVSKTLPLLAIEGAIRRDEDGKVVSVDRRLVLNRWTLNYNILRSARSVRYFVALRGLDKAAAALAEQAGVVFTGPQAAVAYLPDGVTPSLPPTQIFCYALDVAPASLGLEEVGPSSANVIVIRPQDTTLLGNPAVIKGHLVAPLPLVLADLLTLPGRYPQQAEALMDALALTDSAWRS